MTCPGEDPYPNSGDEENSAEDGQEWLDMSWFYSGIGIGFAFGFLGVCGALFFNSHCRHAYFRFLNNMEDWLYVSIRTSRLMRCLRTKWLVIFKFFFFIFSSTTKYVKGM